MKSLQLEWTHHLKSMQEKQLPPLPADSTTPNHHKVLRHHVIYLEKLTKSLHKENAILKTRLDKMEAKTKYDRINGNDIENYITSNKIREIEPLDQLVKQQLHNTATITNLTTQMGNFDKLHLSMLELLENVESLENKVDRTVPEFRKEISKIENQASQLAADVGLVKEEQKNVRDSMKAIGFSVSKLQDRSAEEVERMEKVEEHLKTLEQSTVVQNSRLHDHILKVSPKKCLLNKTLDEQHFDFSGRVFYQRFERYQVNHPPGGGTEKLRKRVQEHRQQTAARLQHRRRYHRYLPNLAGRWRTDPGTLRPRLDHHPETVRRYYRL